MKKIRSIALLAITWAVMLSALTFAGSADAATTGHSLCQASGYTQIDGECMHIVRTEKLSPEAGAALEKAFATPAGRVAVQEAFQGIDKAKSGVVVQEPSGRARPAWACPGGVSCGVSHSGGTHFWVIASYAAIYDVGTAGFWAACTGALSPVIDPVAAVAACAVVAGALRPGLIARAVHHAEVIVRTGAAALTLRRPERGKGSGRVSWRPGGCAATRCWR